MLLRVLAILGFGWFVSVANAELTSEIQEARDRGITIYKQRDWYDSQPLLREAAQAGDREAQYYLGEALRLSKRYMTAEAQKWYEAAAEQGDIHAMLRLASKRDLCGTLGTCAQDQGYWRQRAREEGLKRANQSDPQGMSEMYNVTGDPAWLKKAADAGSPGGQYQLANYYKAGNGWFLLPGARQEEVEKWYTAAAESGHPLAMMQVFEISANRGDFEGARKWLQKAAESGLTNAVSTYGAKLAHVSDIGFPLDLVKGHALISLIVDLNSSTSEYARDILVEVEEKMTEEQLKQARVYAEEWKKTRPPLSFFDPRFGF